MYSFLKSNIHQIDECILFMSYGLVELVSFYPLFKHMESYSIPSARNNFTQAFTTHSPQLKHMEHANV